MKGLSLALSASSPGLGQGWPCHWSGGCCPISLPQNADLVPATDSPSSGHLAGDSMSHVCGQLEDMNLTQGSCAEHLWEAQLE